MRTTTGLLVLYLTLGAMAPRASADAPDAPGTGLSPDDVLVVLTDTGRQCGDLPAFEVHPGAAHHRAVLTRGFSGRLLRLFRWEQQYLARRDGRRIEPAYLLLSGHQGGFPRFGFCLGDERKPEVAYVDLHRDGAVDGRFGAMDQVFPHELLHVILHQLAGEPPPGGANQVHALGVRTDPFVAFNEGLAEHAQVVAVDDPDASPPTAALARDPELLATVGRRLDEYRRALTARWSPAPRARLGFLLWYNQAEQTLRYHGVKANRYVREPDLPARLLAPGDPYAAYLLESVLPGAQQGPLKSPGRLRATEGVVSAVVHRLMSAPTLQRRYEDAAFYGAFGAQPAEVDPQSNAYLKLFAVLAEDKPFDVVTFLEGFARRFPADAAVVHEVAGRAGFELGGTMPAEIWLSNEAFATGTTLFDQFRGVPRAHTFDLNAASLVDLLGVPGMTRPVADAVLRGAPYGRLDDLGHVPGMSPEVLARFRDMAIAMERLRASEVEDNAVLSLQAIVMPSVWRALAWLAVGWVAAAIAYASVRRLHWARLVLNGLAAALAGLTLAWVFGPAWWVTALTPLLACGAPALGWQLIGRRPEPVRVAAAWALASLPAVLLTQPLF